MYRKIFDVPTGDLAEANLYSLIEREVSEGPYLDYKREAGLQTKGGRKEAAKDAAAFANAYGGYLIYGMEEDGGLPKKLVGVEIEDPDRAASALEHAIHDLTEPAVEAHAQPVHLENGRYAIVVEVPRSLNAPHMADGRFYRRVGRRSVPMDYMDIRRAFSEKGDVIRKMRERLRQRISDIEKGYGPVRWEPWAGAFLYVASIPIYDSGNIHILDPGTDGTVGTLQTFTTSLSTRFSAEGLLATDEIDQYVDYVNFALLTHEGELFHGVGPLRKFTYCKQYGELPPCINATQMELDTIAMLNRNLPSLQAVGHEPPYYLAIALSRAGAYHIGWEKHIGRRVRSPLLILDQLLFEEDIHVISRLKILPHSGPERRKHQPEIAARLKPILDRLWQAGGYSKSKLAHYLDDAGPTS